MCARRGQTLWLRVCLICIQLRQSSQRTTWTIVVLNKYHSTCIKLVTTQLMLNQKILLHSNQTRITMHLKIKPKQVWIHQLYTRQRRKTVLVTVRTWASKVCSINITTFWSNLPTWSKSLSSSWYLPFCSPGKAYLGLSFTVGQNCSYHKIRRYTLTWAGTLISEKWA